MDRGIYRMGIIAGIPLKVHWSFGLLISFIVFLIYSKGLTPNEAFWFILMIVGLFVSVILHELGHAMAAKYYGIKTQDIIISPIGGIARLEFLPIKPIQEFVVALSGPTVNIIIALIIFLSKYSYFMERNIVPNDYDLFNGLTGWIHFLFSMNLALFAFNLIPAFPMDGGRIIRALLAMKMEKYSATVLAARIGQVLAVGFVIIGIFNLNPILAFIGVFVFSMAQREVSIAGQDLKLEAISAAGFYKANFTPSKSNG